MSGIVEGKENRYKAQERFPTLLELAQKQFGGWPSYEPVSIDDSDEIVLRQYDVFIRILFSLLIDADRLDTEMWDQQQRLGKPWERPTVRLAADALLSRLRQTKEEKTKEAENKASGTPQETELNILRNQIFAEAEKCGENSPQGFFTLTVPTGGGKTLSSMAFALAHAKRHKLRRIIVVLPYLSIIEQNAHEYRQIFGRDQVLEHHSAVERPEKAAPSDHDISDDPPQASDLEKAVENWDAPIIVTTSVQFIETLFASATNRARKLHNVAHSVVIFDEVQTLPTHLLEPTLDVLRELKNSYGVSFLFCSATQPAFRKSANLKCGFAQDELNEIAPHPDKLYHALQRVNYRIQPSSEKWDWDRLAHEMLASGAGQALCVVNLRRQAFDAWQTMKTVLSERARDEEIQECLFHLSSAMCPAHRLDLLGLSKNPPPNNVKARLKENKSCWVISTQLIEAGVDVDFPVVFRAMGPLDSIVQSAGRCNREGKLRDANGNSRFGDVIVFHPQDDGLPQGVYAKATAIAPAYLDPQRLATDSTLFGRYFNELYQLTPTDHQRRGEHTIQEDRAEFNFRTVAERAKVIRDDTISVIVPYGPAEKLIDEIREIRWFDRDTLRAMLRQFQRYMVSLRQGPRSDYEQLLQIGGVQPLLPGRLEIPVLEKHCYKQLGIVVKNRPLEDFSQ